MDEGSAKTIAEMELNFEKEMQAIDRQKEDALRKKIEDARTAWDANPENKGKSFDGSGLHYLRMRIHHLMNCIKVE